MSYKLKDGVEIIHPKEVTEEMIIEEVYMLKEYFNNEEIAVLIEALSSYEIDGDSPSYCIYGTMTGNCNDNKVLKFIETLPIIVQSSSHNAIEENNQFNCNRLGNFNTPLEQYIMLKNDDDVTDNAIQDFIYKILTQ